MVGIPDIGAYEAGNFNSYGAWIWESLPGGSTAAQPETGADFDGDEATNNDEWIALTDPASGASFFAPESAPRGASLVFTFPTGVGRSYRLQQCEDLAPASWIAAPGQPVLDGNGSILNFTVPRLGVPRRFYRIDITRP
jgi:hypothetical protein